MKPSHVLEFATNLAAADSAETAVATGSRFFAEFGAVHLVYATGDLLAPDPLASIQFATTVPNWFLETYTRENFGRKDHTSVHTISGALTPVLTGSEMVGHLPCLDAGAHEVLEEALPTGLLSGISLPMPFIRPGMRGAVTIATSERERSFLALLRAHQFELRLAASYFHARMQALVEVEGPVALTRRQRECLLWLARGLKSDQIAERLGLRRVTVDLHLGSARKKLKAATREQALAKALALGLLNP